VQRRKNAGPLLCKEGLYKEGFSKAWFNKERFNKEGHTSSFSNAAMAAVASIRVTLIYRAAH